MLNSICNSEGLSYFLLKLETNKGCTFSLFLFNIVPEALVRQAKREKETKETKGVRQTKEERKFLGTNHKVFYIEISQESTYN